MADNFYAGAYWAIRHEDVESCTERLAGFLKALDGVHPLLREWFKPRKGRVASVGRPVERTPDALRALLLGGRNKGDTDGAVIEELGFSVSLWNGKRWGVGLRVGCGRYSKWVGNAVVVDLPEPEGAALDLYRPRAARAVMAALVEYWEPDWATLVSHALRRLQQAPPRGPVMGWMTYLSHSRNVDVRKLPDGVLAEELRDGTLITIAPDVNGVRENVLLALRHDLGDALLPGS